MKICITLIRAGLLALVVCAHLLAAEAAVTTTPAVLATPGAPAPANVSELVATFNPDLFALEADNKTPKTRITNMFTAPASDIAREVLNNTILNTLVFLPFLILPLVLLFYVIFRFRDRGDGRKAATFVGNHALEIVWTAVPCVALLVVSVPVWQVLWKMELPPANAKDALNIEVRGKKFAWDYKYQDYQLSIGQDLVGRQEPLVLPKGRTTMLYITSNDVNHAWWVPAFGVKRDAIIGRYTNIWFTPDTEGFFKGQCAELCGTSHGLMVISAVVVKPELFQHYLAVQRHRNEVLPIWKLLQPSVAHVDQDTLDKAVAAYLATGRTPERELALRYWIASDYASVARARQRDLTPAEVLARGVERCALLDRSLLHMTSQTISQSTAAAATATFTN